MKPPVGKIYCRSLLAPVKLEYDLVDLLYSKSDDWEVDAWNLFSGMYEHVHVRIDHPTDEGIYINLCAEWLAKDRVDELKRYLKAFIEALS